MFGPTASEIDLNNLKDIGPIWGPAESWRAFKTDNVVSVNYAEATDLVSRGLHTVCNMYVPTPFISKLSRNAALHSVPSYHVYPLSETVMPTLFSIAAKVADIVLVIGLPNEIPQYDRQLIANIFTNSPTTQWVQLDTNDPQFGMLADTTENVLRMLGG